LVPFSIYDYRLNTPPIIPESLLVTLTSILQRLEPGGLFPHAQPLEAELGCGDGTFLLEYAQRYPQRNFIGVERLLGRLKKIDRQGRRRGLTNLRGVRIEAGYFLEFLLPPHSVTAIHVYFPDPWPKRRHQKNRLVNERFPELCHRALVPGGAVHLRTDHGGYFDQMRAVFEAGPLFSAVATPAELGGVLTDFEREFVARGVATRRASYGRE
jgi:tRNA (guanine-N7-)-methyltransferase